MCDQWAAFSLAAQDSALRPSLLVKFLGGEYLKQYIISRVTIVPWNQGLGDYRSGTLCLTTITSTTPPQRLHLVMQRFKLYDEPFGVLIRSEMFSFLTNQPHLQAMRPSLCERFLNRMQYLPSPPATRSSPSLLRWSPPETPRCLL